MFFLANVYSGKMNFRSTSGLEKLWRKTLYKKFLMKKFLTEEEYNEVYGNAFIDDAFEWLI